MSEESAVSRGEVARRCLAGECPDCGATLPAGKPWSFPLACPSCGMTLRRHDGFFLGALVWNYGMTSFGALPLTIVAWKFGILSGKAAIALAIMLGLLLPVLLYRLSWKIWLALYYACLPDQLPANGATTEDTDD